MSVTLATDAPCIERRKCYRLPVFQAITGPRKHAMRTARNKGLRVHYVNGSAFVTGDDWFAYLEVLGTKSEAASSAMEADAREEAPT